MAIGCWLLAFSYCTGEKPLHDTLDIDLNIDLSYADFFVVNRKSQIINRAKPTISDFLYLCHPFEQGIFLF